MFRRGQYIYDTTKFHNRVVSFEMTDHHPPRLELMAPFCREVHEYLEADERNVVAVGFLGFKQICKECFCFCFILEQIEGLKTINFSKKSAKLLNSLLTPYVFRSTAKQVKAELVS